jgi:hypothetical protein
MKELSRKHNCTYIPGKPNIALMEDLVELIKMCAKSR